MIIINIKLGYLVHIFFELLSLSLCEIPLQLTSSGLFTYANSESFRGHTHTHTHTYTLLYCQYERQAK